MVDLEIAGARFSGIPVAPPFGPEASLHEDLLEWYFERWLYYPMLDGPRAAHAARVVCEYGDALFGQVFADRNAQAALETWRTGNADRQRIEIVGGPAFHQLHWEALRDPERGRALGTEFALVRAAPEVGVERAGQEREAPVVRVLVVTARPGGARDVGYRTISRPLLDALRNIETPVEVDLLRPGTFKALSNLLEARKDRPYHMVHFDLHGALMSYEAAQAALSEATAPDGLTMRYGRGQLSAFDGKDGFLVFEPEERPVNDGDPVRDLAKSDEVAALLARYKVPIAILNACQSGKQVEAERGTSLGARLMEAGAQNVLAMGYSVTVTAAEKMMPVIYKAMFSGETLGEAVRQARLELQNDRARKARFDREIDLEDWILPVLYQREDARLAPRRMYPEEETEWLQRQARYVAEPDIKSGFLGRDLDVLQIERRLTEHNALLIHAGGGTGKTTLLHHLAAWWQRTGWIEGLDYFGYDQRAWTLEQILAQLGQTVLDEAERRNLIGIPDALQQKIVQRLRGRRWLLVLDNLESVTAEAFAIKNELPPGKREEIRAFLAKLVGGKTMILLGSRGPVDWLEAGVTRAGPVAAAQSPDYLLRGLDADAASTLAAKTLARVGAAPDMGSDAMRTLMRVLAGHPLAIEVVLPNLRRLSPDEVLQGLSGGGKLDLTAGSEERTASIMACVEFSHANLEPQ
ncbi:MAG: CHAT domain-containing protein, partial [Rhodobacteraceae bacterium]|nr:CHAT domain-containing protein [Paracoccaceae bacterium]